MGHWRRNRRQRNSWATRQRIEADVEVEENGSLSVNAASRPLQLQPLTHCIYCTKNQRLVLRTCTQSTSLLPDPDLRFALRRLKVRARLQTRSSANRCSSPVSSATTGQRVQSAILSATTASTSIWRLVLPRQLMILIQGLVQFLIAVGAPPLMHLLGEGSAEMPAAATAKEC